MPMLGNFTLLYHKEFQLVWLVSQQKLEATWTLEQQSTERAGQDNIPGLNRY